MSIKTSSLVMTFTISLLAGIAVSAVLMFTAAVVMFGLGARTGIPYEFVIGSLLVFKIDVAEESLGIVFGPGFPGIVFALGLLNALLSTVLKIVKPSQKQLPLQ